MKIHCPRPGYFFVTFCSVRQVTVLENCTFVYHRANVAQASSPMYRWCIHSCMRFTLSRDWDTVRGTSRLTWDRARDALRDSWERVRKGRDPGPAIIVHAGSCRELNAVVAYCQASNSTLVELATGSDAATASPGFPVVLCPNTNSLMLKFIECGRPGQRFGLSALRQRCPSGLAYTGPSKKGPAAC